MLIPPATPQNRDLEQFYLPFERVDNENRTITSYFFTTPTVRGDNYNLKYEALKRAASRYMKMPCIREMHQPKAAGSALELHFDDATRTGWMKLKVVDDQAWAKVDEGVYRGLSLGGNPLILRGQDIEEFDWIETSLVDRPKDKGAVFFPVARVESGAALPVIELEPDTTDEEVEIARAELTESLGLERYSEDQPRDGEGKWTIVGGHRVSVHGHAIDHNDIHEAKKRFGLTDEATGALLAAHKAGKITTDEHLYRTIAHAGEQAGGLEKATSTHVQTGTAAHGEGGDWEARWASHVKSAPLQQGLKYGTPLGRHELQENDILHLHGDEHNAPLYGKVTKVNPKTIDIESTFDGVTVGQRINRDKLNRPGHVRRETSGVAQVHHFELARAEMPELTRGEDNGEGQDETFVERMAYYAESVLATIQRVDEAEREEAIGQIVDAMELERLELERGGRGWQTQPRDDGGRWTDGGGKLSVEHVQHVMRHEGITEQHHHDEVKRKIESGELKSREDVLKHIDAIHEARKKEAEDKGSKSKDGEPGEKKGEKAPKPLAKAPATNKTGDKPKDSQPKDNEKPVAKKPSKHLEALKKLAKDAHKAFLGGYHAGKALFARADGTQDLGSLVDEFYDALADAEEDQVSAALQAALAVLKGPVERVMTAADVPVRENLEGDDKNKKLGVAIDDLRDRLLDADDGEDTHPKIYSSIAACLAALEANAEANTAGDREAVQRALLADMALGANGPMREAYAWFPAPSGEEVATFQDRTGAALNDILSRALETALWRYMDTLMEAPSLEARQQNTEEFSRFLRVWLNHDAQMRQELSRADGVQSASFAELIAAVKVAIRGTGDVSGAADLERVEMLQGDVSRLEGLLSTVQNEAQALVERVESAEGQVSRLETENTRLRSVQINRTPPVAYTAALPREFEANQVLEPVNSVGAARKLLADEKTQLLQRAETVGDVERGKIAERLAVIDAQLHRL